MKNSKSKSKIIKSEMKKGIEYEIEQKLNESNIFWKCMEEKSKETVIKGIFEEYENSEIKFDKYKTGKIINKKL